MRGPPAIENAWRRVASLPRLGRVELVVADAGLRSLRFLDWIDGADGGTQEGRAAPHPLLDRAEAELRRYVAGSALRDRLPLDLTQHGEFTREVLRATSKVGHGETSTYGAIARAIGKPAAARAVGQALGRNAVPIFVPCHRVLAATGLGGFSGGDGVKAVLLEIEGFG